MNVLDKIRKLQWERGWTDYKLSQIADISQSSFASLFTRNTPPKLDMLQRICDAFGITLSQFFLENEETDILTDSEKKLLTSFRKLSSEKKQALLELLN